MLKAIDEKPQKQSFKGTIAAGLRCVVNVAKDHPVLTTLGIGLAALAGTGVASIINAKPTANQGNSLLINPTIETVKKITIDAVNQFDYKKSESALKQLGYAVAKNLGLSDEDRRKILDGAMATAGMTKEAICAFLEKNITLHKNQTGFSDAVRKWTSDLAYLRNKP
jgi:hypothetical protein